MKDDDIDYMSVVIRNKNRDEIFTLFKNNSKRQRNKEKNGGEEKSTGNFWVSQKKKEGANLGCYIQ